MPEKETTVILWNLLKGTVIIIRICETRGEHRLGTSRMSILMFAGKSANVSTNCIIVSFVI